MMVLLPGLGKQSQGMIEATDRGLDTRMLYATAHAISSIYSSSPYDVHNANTGALFTRDSL